MLSLSLIHLLCVYLFIFEDAVSAHLYRFCTLSLIEDVSQKVKLNSDLALAVTISVWETRALFRQAAKIKMLGSIQLKSVMFKM